MSRGLLGLTYRRLPLPFVTIAYLVRRSNRDLISEIFIWPREMRLARLAPACQGTGLACRCRPANQTSNSTGTPIRVVKTKKAG